MLVYTVWYESAMGKGLWGIYSTAEKADAMVIEIKTEFGYNAWYNTEEVL